MTTDVDLDAIEARTSAATRGPWTNGQDGLARHEVHLSAFLPILELSEGRQGEANAEFIARARTDVPLMAAEIRQLRAENAALLGVVRAAEAWRVTDDEAPGFVEIENALVDAVDALPKAEVPPWRWLDMAPVSSEPDRCRTRCADPTGLAHRCTKRRGHPAGHEWATEKAEAA